MEGAGGSKTRGDKERKEMKRRKIVINILP